MANRAKYHPNEERMATGKGTWRRAPTTPLRTRGTVQQMEPKMIQYTASRHVNPTARMLAGASQLCAFIASENQKPSIVRGVQVRRSIGVTSISTFVLVLKSVATFCEEKCGKY
jgi:hypothetical protein